MSGKPIDEAVRAQFEAWARPKWRHPDDFDQRIGAPRGTYNNIEIQSAWEAWQALTAAQQQGQAVAWHVDAGTEHWVTDDVNEAAGNLAGGCVVRPLSFAGGPLSRGELHTDDTTADHERVRAERRAYLDEIAARNADIAPQPMQQGGGEVRPQVWIRSDELVKATDGAFMCHLRADKPDGSGWLPMSITPTAPPSAPVGVEAIVDVIISDHANATDTDTLRRCVASALAQQPAADPFEREYRAARAAGMGFEDAWHAAIKTEQQPAAVDELIERLDKRLNTERAAHSMGHNAADRERAELIRLLSEAAAALEAAREDGWQPIETAPRDGRQMILLLTPSRFPQVAFSNTWWTAGFSVECKPTHWRRIEPLPAIDQARGKAGQATPR
jgi:hypothetical protein